jgi:hypothetical protein
MRRSFNVASEPSYLYGRNHGSRFLADYLESLSTHKWLGRSIQESQFMNLRSHESKRLSGELTREIRDYYEINRLCWQGSQEI